jgi:hypothetical protein
MAYPTVDAPYGLKPINLIGGQVFAGATRQLVIANTSGTGYGTSIFYGDVVKIVSGGTIEKDTGQATATPCGVFLGCQYTSATTGQLTFSQYYPASLAVKSGTIIQAFVADDPDQLFKVVLVAGTTEDGNGLTPAFLGRTVIGTNAELVQNTGSTVTGDSKVGVYTDGNTNTASLPIRVIDVVPDTANSSGNFCELIVKFNAPYIVSTSTSSGGVTTTTTSTVTGGHQYLNSAGV